METLVKYFFLVIFMAFIFGCSKEYGDSELGVFKFENYISKLIANKDTLEFTGNFIVDLDEETIKNIKEMYVIYDLNPGEIISSIKNRGSIYKRIFSGGEKSLSGYIPKDGGFYDVSVTYRKYKGTSVAQIEYFSFNETVENSIEIVGIYLNGKWNLLTINFLDSGI